ncbi:hypothetical protein ANCDUO_15491 [Ancylostoma duodenale]|uniref:Uncharacterized protein n=1 Tax=Ancylostoma duodenale TaxID=51022 RepID=A0A0C2G647_9BILA|nr:hypothetical protein ANCDUO_15491 [Ancylostoma duodenale]
MERQQEEAGEQDSVIIVHMNGSPHMGVFSPFGLLWSEAVDAAACFIWKDCRYTVTGCSNLTGERLPERD